MPFTAIQVSVQDDSEASDLSDILFEMGALSVDISAASEAHTAWRICALYPLSVNVESMLMIVATHFNLPATPTRTIRAEVFDEKSAAHWMRQAQESFQPIELGRVRISFPWHETRSDMVDVQLDPGIAFGTGEHTTTQLCLSWLDRTLLPGASVLDFGTGTGVLAIAACMLRRDVCAVGVDVDAEAVRIARKNAARNRVDSCTDFFENQHEPDGRVYDVVVANILAPPLKALAPHLAKRLKRGGFIALSGLLVSQGPQVIECYARCGISLHDVRVKNDWALLVGMKQ